MEMHLVYKTHDHQFLVIGVLMENGERKEQRTYSKDLGENTN